MTVDEIRNARPGEFTLRALNNGKLSLSQVEGLDLLLNASNIFSLDQGMSLMSGQLKDSFTALYKSYLNHRSAVEFGFDFLEDIGEEQFNINLNDTFNVFKDRLLKLYSQVSNQGFNLIKPEIVLYGQPNSGKSTLFNKLLNSDRAITSKTAGTTRDYIKEDINIDGSIFSLIDTAGIRFSDDEIETIGISKALDLARNGFFKVLLINPFEFEMDFYEQLRDVDFDLVIYTHSMLDGFSEAKSRVDKLIGPIEPKNAGPIEPKNAGPIEPKNTGPIEPKNTGPIEPKNAGPIEPLILDLTDENTQVSQYILSTITTKYLNLLSFDPVLIKRHSDTIKNIYRAYVDYEHMFFSNNKDIAVLSSELNIVGHCISELLGIVSPDDVLHNIFDNFCIGK
mgnify:CR=1 FL=1